MNLKQIYNALDKGSGIEKQKALNALKNAIDKEYVLMSFIEFGDICKHYYHNLCLLQGKSATAAFAGSNCKAIYFSECKVETCPKWNLL